MNDSPIITTDPAQIRARLMKMAEDGTYVAADLTDMAKEIVVELAARFADQVCDYLTPDEVREVRSENRKRIKAGDETCATHDHCDANELMEAACQSMGFSLTDYDAEHPIAQQRFDLANAAWDLARWRGFDEAGIRAAEEFSADRGTGNGPKVARPSLKEIALADLDRMDREKLLAFMKESDRNGDFDDLPKEVLLDLAVLDLAERKCPQFSRYDFPENRQVIVAREALQRFVK